MNPDSFYNTCCLDLKTLGQSVRLQFELIRIKDNLLYTKNLKLTKVFEACHVGQLSDNDTYTAESAATLSFIFHCYESSSTPMLRLFGISQVDAVSVHGNPKQR